MKKTDFSQNGGWPLTKRDLQHAFEGVEQALKAVCHGFNDGNDAFKIEGCTLTINIGVNMSWTEGYIYHAGEIFHVPAAGPVAHSALATYYWVVDETYYSADPKTFADGNTHNVRKVRKMSYRELVAGDTVYVSEANCVRFEKILGTRMKSQEEAWIAATLQNSFANVVGYDTKFKKDSHGRIRLQGIIYRSGLPGASAPVFTLPAGYRPSRRMVITIGFETVAAALVDHQATSLAIDTNGEVRVEDRGGNQPNVGGSDTWLYLDGVSFELV